jgi:hypothetical protein
LSNDSDTGYVLLPVASLLPAAGQLPPEHQLAFNTFELIAANSTINGTTMSSSHLSPFSPQKQQQRLDRQEMQQPLSPQPPQQ